MIFTRGNGSTFNSSATGELAAGAHSHDISFARSGTDLKVQVAKGCT